MTSVVPLPRAPIACFDGVTEHHDNVGPLLSEELAPGTLLDGRFLIGEALSRSGMATVYKAQDTHGQNQTVAIKVPHLKCECDPLNFARFQREAEIGGRLNHPFLLKFIPIAGPQSRPYLATEYLRGCTLAHLLKAMHPLPENEALTIAGLVSEALQYLHGQGFIHRDLKPANIMIVCDHTIRLMDFGLAAPITPRQGFLSRLTPIFGTPDYMAPEQVKNRRNDARTDLYSLGAILYEMLTGAVPFPSEDAWATVHRRLSGDPAAPRQVNPALSPQAEEIVLHALQRAPADRYQTAAAFKTELDAPEQISVIGYAGRLRVSRAKMSYESTQLLTGVLAGLAVIAALIVFLFVIRHFQMR